MNNEKKNLLKRLFNILKHLILCGFLGFFVFSCDYFSQKNLLTFYYHAENSQKNIVINKLIKQFQKTNDVKIKAIPYYKDDLSKIIKDKNFPFDIIEIDYTNLFVEDLKENLLNFESLQINDDYLYQNYFYPWLKDYYYIFKNKNLIKNDNKFILPLSKNQNNILEFCKNQQKAKIIGIPINNNQITIHFLLSLCYLYDVNLFITNDSLSFTSHQIIKLFKDLISLNSVAFLGTQSEIVKNFEDGNLVYFLGNTNNLKKFRENKNFGYSPIVNKLNQQYCYTKSFLAIRKNSDNLDDSINFLKFLTSETIINKIYGNHNNKLDLKANCDNRKTIQFFENKYYYEINNCLLAVLFEQDTSLYSLIKAELKINKMLKYKKHISYK